jgi:hypothetical protein
MKKRLVTFILVKIFLFFGIVQTNAQIGTSWTLRAAAADNSWRSITYGNGIFVATSASGTGNRVMTSTDGITWTIRTTPVDNFWVSVTFGNGLFVAVSNTGTGNRAMTSPDGINWTIRTTPVDNNWSAVTFGNGLFVAVSGTGSGTGNRAMTSPDGITWTIRTTPVDNNWVAVTFGNNLFVAVAQSGTSVKIMTSPDGITWTGRALPVASPAAALSYTSVTYANGIYVAVASSGGLGNRVITSTDGITWINRTSAADNPWASVTYGSGLFVAVATGPINNAVMTSPDGITWTARTTPVLNWRAITYSNGLFVAVAQSGSGNLVLTSGTFTPTLPLRLINFNGTKQTNYNQLQWQTANEVNTKEFVVEKSIDGSNFTFSAIIAANGGGNGHYNYNDSYIIADKIYYRLKMVDNDGSYNYSNIIVLSFQQSGAVNVYPNPTTDLITIRNNNLLNTTARLVDVNGHVLQSFRINQHTMALDMSGYAKGMYLLLLENRETIKISKL